MAGTLRFSAICKVLLNGVVASPARPTIQPGHFSSYAVPVAAGPVTVTFAPDGWYSGGPCGAKAFAVWN